MEYKEYLQIPGPTNVPERILKAMHRPLVNHRGPEFRELLKFCVDHLKQLLCTENELFIFPSSGSGAIESTIVNFFSSGDTIVHCGNGVFGERAGAIAKAYGLNPLPISKKWGEAVQPEDLKAILDNDPEGQIKAVYVPHCETSTGVQQPIEALARVHRECNHPSLFIVDAVSSMAMIPLEQDKWGIDVVISGSQKGLMLPPGLSLVSLNAKARAQEEKSNLPKWYWNYSAMRKAQEEWSLPYTPPTSLVFGLRESLTMLQEEGMDNVYKRHEKLTALTRSACESMGLELFVKSDDYSRTTTSLYLPENIKWPELSEICREKYHLVLGGGLGQLKGKIFRIGHMGNLDEQDLYSILGRLEAALIDLGYPVKPGTSAATLIQK
jgi:alanine-glyoxylate transaminase/serine-glyoxylate transaminase/serine-pyruvate transaminase